MQHDATSTKAWSRTQWAAAVNLVAVGGAALHAASCLSVQLVGAGCRVKDGRTIQMT